MTHLARWRMVTAQQPLAICVLGQDWPLRPPRGVRDYASVMSLLAWYSENIPRVTQR